MGTEPRSRSMIGGGLRRVVVGRAGWSIVLFVVLAASQAACAGDKASPSGGAPATTSSGVSATPVGTSPTSTATSSPLSTPTSIPSLPLASGEWESGGLIWQSAGEQLFHGIIPVTNGLVGICDPSGEAIGSACTSHNGVTWSIASDPAVFKQTGTDPFRANMAAHGAGGWVAAERQVGDWGPHSPYAVLWHSSDGVSWSRVPRSPILNGFRPGGIYSTEGTFVLLGLGDEVLSSTDGATWRPLPKGTVLQILADANGKGFLGARYTGSKTGPTELFSADGKTWSQIQRPDPTDGLASMAALPGGGYLATAFNTKIQKSVNLRSSDGIEWQIVDSAPAAMDEVVVFAGRLIGMGTDDSSPGQEYQWISADAGQHWQKLAGADGEPMLGGYPILAGDRLLTSTGGVQFVLMAVARAR